MNEHEDESEQLRAACKTNLTNAENILHDQSYAAKKREKENWKKRPTRRPAFALTLCIHLLCLPLARPTQYTYTAALPGSLRAPTDSSDTFCAPLSRPLARHKCFSDELDTAGGILFSLAELQKESTAGDNRWGPQLITRPPATKRTGRRRSPECSSRHPALLSLFSALPPAASECRTGTCFSRSFNSLPPPPLSHSLPPSLRTCLIFLSFVSPPSASRCFRIFNRTPV